MTSKRKQKNWGPRKNGSKITLLTLCINPNIPPAA